MKKIDIRLKFDEMSILQKLVGKELTAIYHDKFEFVNSSSQAVGFETNEFNFYLYSFVEPLDYFGSIEDVAVWSLDLNRYALVDEKDFIKTPIKQTVKSIQIVQENQRLYTNEAQIYDIWLTRGIVFDFGDNQILFEKAVWFSEEIYIQKGYNLIEKISPTSKIVDSDWNEGLYAECSREIVTVK